VRILPAAASWTSVCCAPAGVWVLPLLPAAAAGIWVRPLLLLLLGCVCNTRQQQAHGPFLLLYSINSHFSRLLRQL
jgi:hypothetical protein